MQSNEITFRPIGPEDLPFLCEVYTSTRWEEMSITGWADDKIRVFLNSQFTCQHKHYQENYTAAEFNILCLDGEDIGRLYRVTMDDDIRIIDIALLPEFRNKGIGTKLLTDILSDAAAAGFSVSIHVEKNNPALSLYDRLGFKSIKDVGVYWLMSCKP